MRVGIWCFFLVTSFTFTLAISNAWSEFIMVWCTLSTFVIALFQVKLIVHKYIVNLSKSCCVYLFKVESCFGGNTICGQLGFRLCKPCIQGKNWRNGVGCLLAHLLHHGWSYFPCYRMRALKSPIILMECGGISRVAAPEQNVLRRVEVYYSRWTCISLDSIFIDRRLRDLMSISALPKKDVL